MKINNSSDLDAAILSLELQNESQKNTVINQFHATYESLKPINLLKSSLNNVVHSSEAVENIINATVSLGAGVFSKNLLIGKSTSILKKLLGSLVEFGVAELISRNSTFLKTLGLNLLGKLLKNKKNDNIH